MEEQVLKIMDDLKVVLTGEYPFNVEIDSKEKASKEITSMVFEFIEWKEEKTEKVDNKYFVFKEILKWRTIYEDVEFTTLNELFQYWWNNVKNK